MWGGCISDVGLLVQSQTPAYNMPQFMWLLLERAVKGYLTLLDMNEARFPSLFPV